MEIGLVKQVDIDQEMQQAFLDYAMSVIVARALPDARDGLKPVQRRILYAMHDMNLGADSAFKKSARVVGEVLGKYHPHGDVAVYEAMARLAQDFSMRYPLVDGQGNFGSIDGDPPAAMRYTEARLSHFAVELMAQIERNTIDFIDNFDGTLTEPEVLPAAAPNLLVNGASGIAVGMATSIPPHNLGEVIDALVFMLDKWEQLDDIGVEDLMKFVQGPDFPTGGIILQEGTESGLLSAYGSGKGRITVRGRIHMEEMGRGRNRLIITELPYQSNKTAIIERIAELVRNGHLEGIADLRDESDRQGMRIVVELKQGVEAEATLRELYQRTPLQTTFGISLLALVDGEPRLLNLKQALRVFLEHRQTVVKRRSEFDLARARNRAHILEGLRTALKNLDEVIALIRNAPDVETARARLMKRFKLSEIQAQAILDMQLRRLASLERKKIDEEYKEVTALIKDLEGLLRSPRRMRQVVSEELLALKQTYGDRRRTQIFSLKDGDSARTLLTTTDLIPAQEVWVGVTGDGKIGRLIENDLPAVLPRRILRVSTHATLYLATRQGYCAAVAVHALPEVSQFESGVPLHKVSALEAEDQLAFLFHLPAEWTEGEEAYILTGTRQGMVKKTSVSELPGPSAQRFALVKVNPEDELLVGLVTDGKRELLLVTALGMGIRFSEEDVRPMGLVAAGVMGVKLGDGDTVVSLQAWDESAEVFLLASDGHGWRMPAGDFPHQGRYGQGVIACHVPLGAELVGAALGTARNALVAQLTRSGTRKLKFSDAGLVKRAGRSTALWRVKPGDEPAGLWLLEMGGQVAKGRARSVRKPVGETAGAFAGGQPKASRAGSATGRSATTRKKPTVGEADSAPSVKVSRTRSGTTPTGVGETTSAKGSDASPRRKSSPATQPAPGGSIPAKKPGSRSGRSSGSAAKKPKAGE